MWRITIAGFRAHLRRLLGTAAAVVLGVGLVTGTLIFNTTASAAFFGAFARGAAHIDASIQPVTGADKSRPPLPPSTLTVVGGLPDVRSAAGRADAPLPLLGADNRPLLNFGRVGTAVSTDGDPALLPYTLDGRLPAGDGEALLDTATATHQGVHVGATITVLDRGGTRHTLTVTGLMDFGVSKAYADQSVVGLPSAVLTGLTGSSGYTEIVATARPGVSPARLVADIRAALGPQPHVVTGDQRRLELADNATRVATQFTFVLLIFGAVALLVSAFVIYNTFAVLAAHRVRETALLRCVGATRRQVFTSTITESALLGFGGAVLGVLAGAGIAAGLFALLSSTTRGALPAHAIVVRPDAVLTGILAGTVVTVAAALLPALRATRTTPLAALRDTGAPAGSIRIRAAIRIGAAVLVAAGAAVLVHRSTGLSNTRAATYGIVTGGVLTFLALLIVLPMLAGPACDLLGRALAPLAGTPARIAAANTRRNPARTAVTTATLTIGIGLMALFSVIFASIDRTAHDQLAGHYPVDYVANGVRYGDTATSAGIAPAFATALRGEHRFAAVVEVRTATVTLDGHPATVGAVDPHGLGTLVQVTPATGSLTGLRAGTVVIAAAGPRAPIAAAVGDTVALHHGTGTRSLTVVATGPLTGAGIHLDALVTWDEFNTIAGPGDDTAVLIKVAPEVPSAESRAALDRVAAGYPLVVVNSLADLTSGLQSEVSQLVTLFGGLIAVAVLISLFGVGNTMSMSVVERTRESATMRAIGLTRAQLRLTLLLEALLMGLLSATAGISLGLVFGQLVVRTAFAAIGPTVVSPWGWLAAVAAIASTCAVLAAVLPAHRATRQPVVAAMAET